MKNITKVMAVLMLVTALFFAVGCHRQVKKDEPAEVAQEKQEIAQEKHEYVDLGLPSGTLWATYNVGADAPEEYGDHFPWGETLPNTMCDYEWGDYKYSEGGRAELTKYCFDASYGRNGFTDTLTVLQSMDDAATANWGNDWCMPTEAQWRELLDNTTNSWTTQNGVEGQLFTAPNGNSLFLPAAGSFWDDMPNYVGARGYYWSSSLDTGSPDYAWEYEFYSDRSSMDETIRNGGFSVRPVRCQ